MYRSFFGLQRLPFEDRPDAQFFYKAPDREEALAELSSEPPPGKSLALLVGGGGMGKTMLIRTMLARMRASDHVVVLTLPAGSEMDLVRETCKGFGAALPASNHRARGLAKLRRHLRRTAKGGGRSILVIDQAENLTSENLEQLAAVSFLRNDAGSSTACKEDLRTPSLLTMVLAAQPQLMPLFDRSEFAALRRQVFCTRELVPLTLKETGSYIEHRLRTSGAAGRDIFEDGAVAAIHGTSNGIPRLINHLCNAAMLAAYDAGQKSITRKMGIEVTRGGTSKYRSADARKVTLQQAQAGVTGLPGGMAFTSPPEREVDSRTPGGGFAPNASPGGVWEEPAGFSSPVELAEDGSIDGGGDPGALGSCGKSGMVSSLKKGEVSVERLERTLARAERMTSTHEASLTQYAAFEKHLTSLTESGERLIQRLSHSAQQATATLDGISGRVEAILGVAERRVEAVESIAAHAAELSDGAEEQVQCVERTCEQANDVESRLTAFAEQLAEKADEVQERLSLLMKGLESSEGVQDKLLATLEKASSFATQADERTDAQCAQLKDAIEEAQRFRNQLTDAALASYRRKLESQFEANERTRIEALEVARTTLQTTSDRAAAVSADAEARINSLLDKCRETVRGGQRDLAGFADDAIKDHQTRIREEFKTLERSHLETVEDVQSKLKHSLEQASSAATEADDRISAMRAGLRQMTDEVQQTLQTFSEVALARYRKKLQDELEAYERSHRDAIEAAVSKHETIRRQTAALVTQGEQTLSALEEKLQKRLSEAKRTAGRFTDEALAQAQRKLESHEEAQRKLVEATITAHRAKLQEVLAESASLAERLDAGATAARKEIGDTICESERAHAALMEKVHEETADAGQCIERLEARNKDLQSSTVPMAKQLDGTAKRVGQLVRTIQDVDSSVDELVGRADSSGENLAAVVQRGDKLLAEVQSSSGHVQALQHNVANSLIEIGSASERVASVRDKVRQCEEVATRLASGEAAGGQIVKQLGELLASAERIQESMLQSAVDAAGNRGQLDSQITAAGRVLQDLSQASAAGSRVIEQADEAAKLADRAANAANEQVDRLTSETTAGEQISGELKETVAQGGELRDTVRLLVAGAAESVTRLDSHNAAASSVLRELSEANITAHRNLEQADAAAKVPQESLDNAKERLEKSMQDAQALTTTTEGQTRQLAEHNTRAEQLVESIRTVTESGQVLDEKLTKCTEEAKKSVVSMAEDCSRAENLVARLGSIRRVLSSAIDAESSVKETLERVQTTHDKLSTMTDNAEKQETALGASTSNARGLVRTQQELGEKAEALVEQMNEQLPAGQASLEAGERLIGEFVRQAEALGKKIGDLHRKAARVEQTMTQATAKPSEIIADARTQAAQLERVCATVRKVFAGVSRVSLEARNHVNEFKGTSEEATERLARLKAETDRASEMLREWVEEAGRSQARLERTLQSCPSIHQTHSANALGVLAEASKPIARVANPSATGQPTTVPELEREVAMSEHGVAHSDTRSQEVSRIIDDAKQSAGGGGHGSRRSQKTKATVHTG